MPNEGNNTIEENTTVKEVKVLRTGDGEIRVGVSLGYSMQIKDIYVKPSVYLEVPMPLDEEVDEYIDKVINYLSPKLKDIERRIMRMAGFKVSD